MTYTFRQQFSWIKQFSKGSRAALSANFFLELLGIVCSLLFVYWSKLAVDRATSGSSYDLTTLVILIIASIIVGVVIRYFCGWIDENIRLRMGIQLQNRVMKDQMLASWQTLKERHTGDLMIRLQEDNKEVVQMIGSALLSFAVTLLKLIASLFFLWSLDPILAVMILAVTPVFLFSKVYFKKVRALNREAKSADSTVANILQENLRFRTIIRALGLVPYRQAKLVEKQRQVQLLKKRQIKFSLFSNTLVRFVMNAGYLLAFIWGIYRLNHQEITFGTMTAFLQLVSRIQTPILSAAAFIPSFVRFRVSLDRIMELEEGDKEPEQPGYAIASLKAIVFDNVSFKYEDTAVINQLSLLAKLGEPMAVLGSSGRGKTTLLRLMLALCKPDSGRITLNTDDHLNYTMDSSLRNNFAFVPQGNSLFTGTILENLVSGRDIDTKKIANALELACATFVDKLPNQLNTRIGESGYGLSEGQAQRIAIARAILQDAPVWLFDEPTSALDEDTSAELVNHLLYEGKNKIMIFVTHDLKLADRCQHTVYLH